MTITKSGELASFYTVNKAPIKHLRVYFSPKQVGEGDPSPENVRTINGYDNINLYQSNINLLNLTFCLNRTKNGTTTTVNSNGTITIIGTVTTNTKRYWNSSDSLNLVLQPGTYSLYPENLYIEASNGTRYNNTFSLTTSTTFRNLCFIFTLGDYINKTIYPILSKPDKINSIYFSSDIGTIYGGYVDLITGEVCETHSLKTFNGSEQQWLWSPSSNGIPYITIDSMKSGTWYSDICAICDMAVKVNASSSGALQCLIGYNNKRIYFYNTTTVISGISNLDDFTNWLATNNITITYPLETPLIYHLASTQLQTFIGQNHIWSNADRVEVEYDLAESNDELYRRRNIILKSQPHLELSNSANSTNSSNIVHFNTDISANLQSLKVNFTPIQSGSGDPSPNNVRPIKGYNGLEVTRCGKNLLHVIYGSANSGSGSYNGVDYTYVNNTNNELNYVEVSGTTTTENSFRNLNYEPNKLHAFNGRFALSTGNEYVACVTSSNAGNIRPASLKNTSAEYIIDVNINPAATYSFYRLEVWPRQSGQPASGKVYPMVRFPEDDGTYESYNGITYTINFPTTIYGGYIDLIKGELVATMGKYTIDENTPFYPSTSNPTSWIRIDCSQITGLPAIKSRNQNRINQGELCDKIEVIYSGADRPGTRPTTMLGTYENNKFYNNIYIYDMDKYNTSLATSTDLENYLRELAPTFIYPIEPITFSLTPQTLKTLRGINNIWSTANGNIEVSYWTH